MHAPRELFDDRLRVPDECHVGLIALGRVGLVDVDRD
jgi:hypothetical protein